MSKSNTIQNGKGMAPEKGINWKKYWESEYWDTLAAKKRSDTQKEENTTPKDTDVCA